MNTVLHKLKEHLKYMFEFQSSHCRHVHISMTETGKYIYIYIHNDIWGIISLIGHWVILKSDPIYKKCIQLNWYPLKKPLLGRKSQTYGQTKNRMRRKLTSLIFKEAQYAWPLRGFTSRLGADYEYCWFCLHLKFWYLFTITFWYYILNIFY